MLFRFERSDRGNGWEWVYRGKANNPIYLNDFASPTNPSSRRYTGKLIKKLQAVTAIDGSVDRVGNGCATARLQEHEIALQIDTRFTRQEIVSAVEKLLKTIQPKKKLHVKKYRDYLAVWDLRKEGRTLKEIAEMVWPDKYKTKGGSNYPGEKWVLIQRASDHEEAAKKLIDSSFPSKKYR